MLLHKIATAAETQEAAALQQYRRQLMLNHASMNTAIATSPVVACTALLRNAMASGNE